MKVSARENSKRTGSPVRRASSAARYSCWYRSCLAPKPPPMCSVITRILLMGMPSTSDSVPRTMNGAWVEA